MRAFPEANPLHFHNKLSANDFLLAESIGVK